VGNYVPDELAEQPLLRFTLSGPYTAGTLARLARERITPRLGAVPGVAGVDVGGGAEQGVTVAYDATRLRQLAVSPDALRQALKAAQMRRALGVEQGGVAERPVVLDARALSLDALAALPVRVGAARVFRLGDLAAIRLEEDSRDFFYRVNGEPAVGLTVSRLPGADAIRTAAGVRRAMTTLAADLPPGVKVRVQSDESVDLARQLEGLVIRGAIACLAVVLVLAVAVLVVLFGLLSPLSAAALPLHNSVNVPVSILLLNQDLAVPAASDDMFWLLARGLAGVLLFLLVAFTIAAIIRRAESSTPKSNVEDERYDDPTRHIGTGSGTGLSYFTSLLFP